jgi:dihydrofolate reductase
MRPLRYSINVTLDGCCDHTAVIPDESLHVRSSELIENSGGMLLGRVTYRMMEEAWRPSAAEVGRPDWMEPFAQAITDVHKYVVSSTLSHVDWNSTLLSGDLRESVLELKEQPGKPIVTGGVQLPRALASMGLIDEYEMVVHPRIAGRGPYLMAGLAQHVDLRLTQTVEYDSGFVALRYVAV